MVPDEPAAHRQMVRVIDESGDDFLYPSDYVLPMVVAGDVGRSLDVMA